MGGRSYFFKVSAINSIGTGPLSLGYNIVSATNPDPPNALIRNSITTVSLLAFTWSNGISNGGSAIIDYRISSD